jgi:ammonia channel protein AmtB
VVPKAIVGTEGAVAGAAAETSAAGCVAGWASVGAGSLGATLGALVCSVSDMMVILYGLCAYIGSAHRNAGAAAKIAIPTDRAERALYIGSI